MHSPASPVSAITPARRHVRDLIALALVLALVGAVGVLRTPRASAATTTDFKVGTGLASIDPTGPECLGGYAVLCGRTPEGTMDPLRARGLAITGANGETFINVTANAYGWFAKYKDSFGPNGIYDVRQRIAEAVDIPADNIVVVSDHSHATPDTTGTAGGVTPEYLAILAQGAVDAGVQAFNTRVPASLSVGQSDLGGSLDSSYNAPPVSPEDTDDPFRVLFADDADGNRIATYAVYSTHATVCSKCSDMLTGDWTSWAAEVGSELFGGAAFGAVGTLGATDWRKSGSEEEKIAEAKQRLRAMFLDAESRRVPLTGTNVTVDLTFIHEQVTAPIYGVANTPGATVPTQGDLRIDRSNLPPWHTVNVIGTYAGAVRIGDALFTTFPGEPFPQLGHLQRDAVSDAQMHFVLGAANDFLGYMVADQESYNQTAQEGALWAAGCPEEEFYEFADIDHDGACPGHWALMVSNTIGRHAACTGLGGAARLGFDVTIPSDCSQLTQLDGLAAPAEYSPGGATAPNPGDDALGNPATPGGLKAGVASIDLSWHLGASGGQFAATQPAVEPERVDPYFHATKKKISDALYSRILARAVVVEDAEGDRVAIIGNDLYLPNDLLNRRIAQLLEEHDAAVTAGTKEGTVTGIVDENLAISVSHNHNSAFYSTPSWGAWLFQDVFDLRFFDYVAEGMAQVVIDAVADMRPVRMAAASVPFNEIQAHTYGPKIADDGSPAGQNYAHDSGTMHVVRFDDVSEPGNPKPYANWVTLGLHPEWTWGYDVFNGDITHTAMRIIDRELGTTTVMSQRDTGSSGPHKDRRVHEPQDRREFQESGFEMLDVAGRMWADRVKAAFVAMELNQPTAPYDPHAARRDAQPIQLVPFTTDADISSVSVRVAPPKDRPVPGVSNCKTSALFHGNPQIPLIGLPDCNDDLEQVGGPLVGATPLDERALYDDLIEAGVPIPNSYFAPSLTAVQETAAVHLQAFRLGDIAVTFCPCEQFADTSHNIVSRLDQVEGNVWKGWDWTTQKTPAGRDFCVDNGDGTWTCANPQRPAEDLAPMTDEVYRLMIAQINNDAAGWEDDLATSFGNNEPTDPADIYGNFNHAEATDFGYDLIIPVGMVNDYWGYVPNYREMRAHEHYRKALNALGNHGADFLASRLVTLAANLNGGPAYAMRPNDTAYQVEDARMEAFADAIGQMADGYEEVWQNAAYLDGGAPELLTQPENIQRYAAAHVTWVGGSNYVDLPFASVERQIDGVWTPYATGDGEVQVMVKFPRVEELPSVFAGQFVWEWTAAFEAYGGYTSLPNASGVNELTTPAGTYRFVLRGEHRDSPATDTPYELISEPFTVSPWDGVTIETHELDADGDLFMTFGPMNTYTDEESGAVHHIGPVDYPDGYESPFAILNENRNLRRYGSDDPDVQQWYCTFCRFRAWSDVGEVSLVTVRVTRADGSTELHRVTESVGQAFIADINLRAGDSAEVLRGDVRTEHGEINGAGITVSLPGSGVEADPVLPSTEPLPTTGGGLALAGLLLAAGWRRRSTTGA